MIYRVADVPMSKNPWLVLLSGAISQSQHVKSRNLPRLSLVGSSRKRRLFETQADLKRIVTKSLIAMCRLKVKAT